MLKPQRNDALHKYLNSGDILQQRPKSQFFDDDNVNKMKANHPAIITPNFRNEYDDSIFDYKAEKEGALDEEIKNFKTSWFKNYDERTSHPSFRDALNEIYKKEKISEFELSLIKNYVSNMQRQDPQFSHQGGRREGVQIYDTQNFENINEFQQFQQNVWDEYLQAMEIF